MRYFDPALGSFIDSDDPPQARRESHNPLGEAEMLVADSERAALAELLAKRVEEHDPVRAKIIRDVARVMRESE
jgi:hypothetical protein